MFVQLMTEINSETMECGEDATPNNKLEKPRSHVLYGINALMKFLCEKVRPKKREPEEELEGRKALVIQQVKKLSLSFSNINYYVEVPLGLNEQGILEDRLQLLVNITGAFRPSVLTALVGVSGAGKTMLMDVLAGRKTGGTIEGDVYISGFPKKQETFARISGYCEQNDVHSPCLTVVDSLLFSACLRLPSDIDSETQRAFVHEVMELVELTSLRNLDKR